jgi:hypothetical protein
MIETLQKKEPTKRWFGKYRNIIYEINNFYIGDKENWTYYINIVIDYLPKKHKKYLWLRKKTDKKWHNRKYFGFPYNDYDFHYGITYYSKKYDYLNNLKIAKIGCDYVHYWDEGNRYDIEDILRDIKNTIDVFYEKIPTYKNLLLK